MKIYVIPGVEITHVPVPMISGLAKQARKLGAKLVVVHGETPIEPVYRGTNDAALSSGEVDILAHPGWLTPKQAEQARDADIYLELTSRTGHCLANGWVARVGTEAKAKLLVNTDAHSPEDLLTLEKARVVARGAGLDEDGVQKAVLKNPQELLKKIRGK